MYLCCYVIVHDASVIWTTNYRVGANLVKIPGFSPQERVNCISLKKQPNLKYCQVGQKENFVWVLTEINVYSDGERFVRIKDAEII